MGEIIIAFGLEELWHNIMMWSFIILALATGVFLLYLSLSKTLSEINKFLNAISGILGTLVTGLAILMVVVVIFI